MILFKDGKKFGEYRYTIEDDLEKEIVTNSKIFFGNNSIYIATKRRIESKALGGAVPDGLLFDLSDKDNPVFYLVEVELATHDFYAHIFPQITKFFAFFKNAKSQNELVEKIFSTINTDASIKKEFKKFLGEREIYKFIKDVVENAQNILLIIDGEKDELPEIIETYSDTWGKMVKVLILRKSTNHDEIIYSLDPDFEKIEYAGADSVAKVDQSGEIEYTEEYHLEDVNKEIKEAYYKIKEGVLKANSSLITNPKKYYISIVHNRNIAFFQFSKKKIRLVIMLPEQEVRSKIKYHAIKHLSESVQRFWNGPSCEILIVDCEHLDEIVDLIGAIVAASK
jgi:predicted transport protein